MNVEKLCSYALVAIVALAAYGAIKAVVGVASMLSANPTAIVKSYSQQAGGSTNPSHYR